MSDLWPEEARVAAVKAAEQRAELPTDQLWLLVTDVLDAAGPLIRADEREHLHANSPAAEPEPEPQLPDGEYARVEIMGHDSVTGWVTDGTRAGAPVMIVRDWDGQVLREIPGHSLYQFFPLATPLKRPESRAAITVGAHDPDDVWAGTGEDDDEEDERPC